MIRMTLNDNHNHLLPNSANSDIEGYGCMSAYQCGQCQIWFNPLSCTHEAKKWYMLRLVEQNFFFLFCTMKEAEGRVIKIHVVTNSA